MSDVPNVNFFLNYVLSMNDPHIDNDYQEKYEDERAFYSCNQDDDYVKYVEKGSKEKIDYVSYSGNNEKSSGVFNENGLMDEKAIKELRNKLRTTESPIWHGVISFTEDFGNKNCYKFEQAYKLLKYQLPRFFKSAKLNPTNITWYAGLHENTDNQHIHICFFETTPLRYKRNYETLQHSKGRIPLEAINDFKIEIEKFLVNSKDEMIMARKTLTNDMFQKMKLGVFMNKITSLMYDLPQEGRIAYNSENMKPYKKQIDMVVLAIIKSNKELQKKFNDFDNILKKRDSEIISSYTRINQDYEDKLLRDKCMEDIFARLGNIVLSKIKFIRSQQRRIEYETKSRLANKRIEKNRRKILLNECFRLNDLVNQELMSAFEEYRHKLQIANYKRMQEEGLIFEDY